MRIRVLETRTVCPALVQSARPALWNLPSAMPNTCVWAFNLPRRVVGAAGHFAAQGTMLKFDWPYPLLSLPICLGCISWGMLYLDTTPGDISRGAVAIIANLAFWAGGCAAGRLGVPAGRVVAAKAAVYAPILGLIFILLTLGLIAKQLVIHMYSTSKRGFAGGHPDRPPSYPQSNAGGSYPALRASR